MDDSVAKGPQVPRQFQRPGRSHGVPDETLGVVHEHVGKISEYLADGDSLPFIADLGRGGVDPECAMRNLVVNQPRPIGRVDYILNNSFGMLGINSAVVIRRGSGAAA